MDGRCFDFKCIPRVHQSDTFSTPAARETNKTLWSSEDWTTHNDNTGGACLARVSASLTRFRFHDTAHFLSECTTQIRLVPPLASRPTSLYGHPKTTQPPITIPVVPASPGWVPNRNQEHILETCLHAVSWIMDSYSRPPNTPWSLMPTYFD